MTKLDPHFFAIRLTNSPIEELADRIRDALPRGFTCTFEPHMRSDETVFDQAVHDEADGTLEWTLTTVQDRNRLDQPIVVEAVFGFPGERLWCHAFLRVLGRIVEQDIGLETTGESRVLGELG